MRPKFKSTESILHYAVRRTGTLMGFFQQVVNGGARLTREVAVGRGRLDMLVEWKQWSHKPDTQHLVIFDRTDKGRAMSFADKMYREDLEGAAGPVTVWWF